MKLFLTAAATLLLTSGLAAAGEKGMMHCFAFTVIPEATDADWQAFAEATDKWPTELSDSLQANQQLCARYTP